MKSDLELLFKEEKLCFLFAESKLYCSCGKILPTAPSLQNHLVHCPSPHVSTAQSWLHIIPQLREIFENNFLGKCDEKKRGLCNASINEEAEQAADKKVEEQEKVGDEEEEEKREDSDVRCEELVERITLPPELFCVCLTEHDMGLFASRVSCDKCEVKLDTLEEINSHRAELHKVSQIISGENICFERPSVSMAGGKKLGFFCPFTGCKYNIAKSSQEKFFTTFKLLKQHYAKVHASKSVKCGECGVSFGAATYLKQHQRAGCTSKFDCPCGTTYSSRESLLTHARRHKHQLPAKYFKEGVLDPAREKLAMLQSAAGHTVPIAPKPSALHLNAAIALSELSNRPIPKADIGIQTDIRITPLYRRNNPQPAKDVCQTQQRNKVTTETQTSLRGGGGDGDGGGGSGGGGAGSGGGGAGSGGGGERLRCAPTANSLVQTYGEFHLKTKKRRFEKISQASQCRISPEKKLRKVVQERKTETTQTLDVSVLDLGLSVDISTPVDWYQGLWPLHRNTNGTQTSPRAAIRRNLSEESVDYLPSLQTTAVSNSPGGEVSPVAVGEDVLAGGVCDRLLVNKSSSGPPLACLDGMVASRPVKPKLGEIRQFSTETQTEADGGYLSNCFSWDTQENPDSGNLDQLPGVENLISHMETQTQDDLLFCTNNYTQTGMDDALSYLLGGGGAGGGPGVGACPVITSGTYSPHFTCTTETQTSLTSLAQDNQIFPRTAGGSTVETADVELMTEADLIFHL